MKAVMMYLPDEVLNRIDAIVAERKTAKIESTKLLLTPEQMREAKTILAYDGVEKAKIYTDSVLRPNQAAVSTRTGVITEFLEFALGLSEGKFAKLPELTVSPPAGPKPGGPPLSTEPPPTKKPRSR